MSPLFLLVAGVAGWDVLSLALAWWAGLLPASGLLWLWSRKEGTTSLTWGHFAAVLSWPLTLVLLLLLGIIVTVGTLCTALFDPNRSL